MRANSLRTLAALALLPLLNACHKSPPPGDHGTHIYHVQGIIQHISDDRHVVTIQHDAIPGYMPAMTMDFSVRNENLLENCARGDRIMFALEVTPDDSWIADIQRLGHTTLAGPDTAAAQPAPQFRPGDPLPDAEFIAEDGTHLHLSHFRGSVVVLTFFFTRCPLPNFCPLMNRNFAATRRLLLADPHAPRNWQFLSVSFDPDFDTPQTLTSYADFYRQHNNDRWLFAAATPDTLTHFAAPLGLLVTRSGDSISHNLRTIVIDPRGHLFFQFNDNTWTPQQLQQTILDATQKR